MFGFPEGLIIFYFVSSQDSNDVHRWQFVEMSLKYNIISKFHFYFFFFFFFNNSFLKTPGPWCLSYKIHPCGGDETSEIRGPGQRQEAGHAGCPVASQQSHQHAGACCHHHHSTSMSVCWTKRFQFMDSSPFPLSLLMTNFY